MTNQEYYIGEDALLRALRSHRKRAVKSMHFPYSAEAAKAVARVFTSLPDEPSFSTPPADWNAATEGTYMPAFLKSAPGSEWTTWVTPTSNRVVQILHPGAGSCRQDFIYIEFGKPSRTAAGNLACLLTEAGIEFVAHGGDDDTVEEEVLAEIMVEAAYAPEVLP